MGQEHCGCICIIYQLIGRKSNQNFCPLEYLIECTVASMQQVEYVKNDLPLNKTINDVIIATLNILCKINYYINNQLE